MQRARILLAVDHKMVLYGLQVLLAPEFDVVGSAADGLRMISQSEDLRPNLVIVDIAMPLLDGIQAVLEIRKSDPSIKVVFLATHTDIGHAVRAIEAGAQGYLTKDAEPMELVSAVREVLNGGMYVSPVVAAQLIKFYEPTSEAGAQRLGVRITTRQRQVLQLLAEGSSAKKIAAILNLSPRTVEFHKYQLMRQLRVGSSAELVVYAVRHGIIALPEVSPARNPG